MTATSGETGPRASTAGKASAARRPGGRSARVRARVLAATLALLAERGFDATELPEVARRAGVHPATVYRRWQTKARLVGEALLERSTTLTPTPDTGSLRTDLEQLLVDGATLIRSAPVRGLFEVLLTESTDPEVMRARDRFWVAHIAEARTIVNRAVARSELPPDADPVDLVELLIGPALVRLLLMGREMSRVDVRRFVERAVAALPSTGASTGS